ncbi:MAG TPA: hypothetical protein PLX35_03850 [Cyclobacteriaceae bacterium]|nr:hypothetical protein [Cyclobacteriaceae bacterium]
MEIKIIVWIIIGLIYVFSRSRKKQIPPATPAPDAGSEGHRPMTFEELLQEIQQGKKVEEPPVVVPRPVVQNTFAEPRPLEDVDYDYRKQDRIYEIYDQATRDAFQRPSLEETMKLEDTIVRYKQFKSYEKESKPSLARQYALELRDPSNFRKAFIMSEILNRRF